MRAGDRRGSRQALPSLPRLTKITESGLAGTLHRRVTIETLPDDVLIDIFEFYIMMDKTLGEDQWHTLVHVCRRWRLVVYASPHRLRLKLLCTQKRPSRRALDVWPALPIVISGRGNPNSFVGGADNIIAALERHSRVCYISLWDIPISVLENVVEAMQGPFPELTHLELMPHDKREPVFPDAFLRGSAPRLRTLWLDFIPLRALRPLLLSAHDLVDLRLLNIPESGYISPQAMVACVSVMTRLETLNLGFHSPQSRPDRTSRRPPPMTRVDLPVLTHLWYQGPSEYLDDFVARINAPQLHIIEVMFFNQLVFDISHLPQLFGRTEAFKALNQAYVVFHVDFVQLRLSLQNEGVVQSDLALGISCKETDWQLSALEQLCSSSLPPLSALERLDIVDGEYPRPRWQDDMESEQWLEPFRPFSAVKKLHVSRELGLRVARALQEHTEERELDVLPVLRNLYFGGFQPSGTVREAIGPFVAARQLSGHPVAVDRWERGQ